MAKGIPYGKSGIVAALRLGTHRITQVIYRGLFLVEFIDQLCAAGQLRENSINPKESNY